MGLLQLISHLIKSVKPSVTRLIIKYNQPKIKRKTTWFKQELQPRNYKKVKERTRRASKNYPRKTPDAVHQLVIYFRI